ncbi:MAG: cation:dicarboxylase symporter family transporter [Legionellales bacterium]|nr:cation:dicarboxylase symporter family transporter [Legionellales bacterium]
MLLITCFGLLIWLQLSGVSFGKRVFIALISGIAFGCLIQWLSLVESHASTEIIASILNVVGNGYLALLKMLVIPLLFTAIIHSLLNMGELKGQVVTSIAARGVCLLLLLTALASGIGAVIALLFHVGQGLTIAGETFIPTHHYKNIAESILGILPSNPIESMLKGNTLGIAILATLIGFAGLLLYRQKPETVEPFKQFIHSLFEIIKQLTRLIIALTPLGSFALLALVSLHQGWHSLITILDYVAAMYVAMLLVLLFHCFLLTLRGISVIDYIKKVSLVWFVALTTSSSFGTLPVTESVLSKQFKLREISASFIPSIGSTVGMNACAGIFPAVLVVMAMTILHQPITVGLILKVMVINMIASLGISGIPGTGIIAASVTLSALGLPYDVISLVIGVDALIDMGRTLINVNGTMVSAIIVDGSV